MKKIKNLEKAAEEIKEAGAKKKKITLYGDADVDGTCSVVILEEALEELGFGNISVYFPDRDKEGYGLSFKALDYLGKKFGKDFLLILLDLGITNFQEIKEARKRGVGVILIDHHQPFSTLPEASLVVNPKQKEDKYPFKNFANAGLAFRLAEEMLREKIRTDRKNNFLELVALATIADMMEPKEDNEIFIKAGLESLQKTKRKGLEGLKEKFDGNLPIREIAQQMISILNAGEVIDHKTEIYNLLVCNDKKEAQGIVEVLIKKNNIKQEKIKAMLAEVENKISLSDPLIFESGEKWEIPLLGSIASKLCHKTKKPVFLLKKGKKKSRGAVRVPSDVNAVNVMEKYSDLLESFGGHPPAAGLSIKNENIEQFKQKLIEHFNSR